MQNWKSMQNTNSVRKAKSTNKKKWVKLFFFVFFPAVGSKSENILTYYTKKPSKIPGAERTFYLNYEKEKKESLRLVHLLHSICFSSRQCFRALRLGSDDPAAYTGDKLFRFQRTMMNFILAESFGSVWMRDNIPEKYTSTKWSFCFWRCRFSRLPVRQHIRLPCGDWRFIVEPVHSSAALSHLHTYSYPSRWGSALSLSSARMTSNIFMC